MFTKFVAESRAAVQEAREIARRLDSPTVEAEHLLLAVARESGTTAHAVLAEAGLDYERIQGALDAEVEESLAAVGVELAAFDLSSTPAATRTPRWGSSAKLALHRAAKLADARRDRRLRAGHIVLGVLRAPAGTVPRALDRAGIDRAELGRRIAATL